MKKNKILQFLMAASLSSTLLFSYVGIPANAASTSSDKPKFEKLYTNPNFEKQLNDIEAGKSVQTSDSQRGLGFIQDPIQLPASDSSSLFQASSLPSKYDLRSKGKVTSVKNQLSSGACWAFAAIGSMESCLLPKDKRDFSENNLKNNSGFDYDPNEGGQNFMATAYLSRWSGPVSESSDPYDPSSTSSPTNKPVQKHVQNVQWLLPRKSATDLSTIKNAIIKHGAVATPIYMDSIAMHYNSSNAYYYRSTHSTGNHMVDIVGWDDSYSKSKFVDPNTGTSPAGNGAFIVKNSWGTSWGDNGYFYVSYYDKSITYDGISAVYYDAESTSNYKHIYQYDTLGFTTDIGIKGTKTLWYSNVFKASASEKLSAVSFYTLSPNTKYEVYVCTNYKNASSMGSSKVLKAKGTMTEIGYHTIKLSSATALTSGKKFAVIVKVTSSDDAVVPIEDSEYGYSQKATSSAGQSFVSVDGKSFEDVRNVSYSIINPNVCLKAFTTSNSTKIVADAQDSNSVLDKFIKFSSALFGGLK